MTEMIHSIINLLNAVGAGVLANFLYSHICKRLDGSSTGNNKKH